MKDDDRDVIRNEIAPLLQKAKVSLLLGAGFSITNSSALGRLPTGDGLRDMILEKCGKKAGPRTTLKDAYLLGSREIPDFNLFLAECFTVKSVPSWQERIFSYPWGRIYTTNIDNVLNVALEQCTHKNQLGGDFVFANYLDPNILSSAIGSIPVVSIHGTCLKLEDGFIFSSLEYAKAAVKVLDWHRDLAAKILTGGLIVVGNQLDESDIDSHLAIRNETYRNSGAIGNFIVMPNPDEIKAENYAASGYRVLDCTAEEFFTELFKASEPRTMAEIVLNSTPSIKKAVLDVKAMTWFRNAFKSSVVEMDDANSKTGILRHFITGSDPDWFFIVNDAHATTSAAKKVLGRALSQMQENNTGVGILHITGPSGSGKTTAIRSAVRELVRTYPYIYEFNSNSEIDTDFLKRMIEGFKEKTIFIFYSAAEYYFAINYIADRLQDHRNPYALFILEDRTNEYRKSFRQIADPSRSEYFDFPALTLDDAELIAEKIQSSGLVINRFSELDLKSRARIIVDKERGYSGDLLSALFSLTSHENFEQKIFEEYYSVPEGLPRKILDVVSILSAQDFTIPIDYIAGFLSERMEDVHRCLSAELAGVLVSHSNVGAVKCRHRIIAQYYFNNCIARSGNVEMIVGILKFLARQFTIDEIRFHPLPYRMYKKIISFEFLYDSFFPQVSRQVDTERTYHEAQRFFGQDGVFWLHFGRYYRKTQRWDESIDCFRTGLNFYDSFQTRHSLGTVLLEKYIAGGCEEFQLYQEGTQLLETERARRGIKDPYPTTTLFDLLLRIVSIAPENTSAVMLLKDCINFGFKHFSDDEFLMKRIAMYMKRNQGNENPAGS
ncbi:P-loop NTPase [Alcaligenes nematophilus]|uniref:P-loop NTPase n=1 Tax=Alcaligenes faecalis TaxID=511 RepID=UPI001933225D|nr:ATP-binding protein [Alcaligenes faecalis]QRF90776.1 hypothetical protein CLH39_11265 [Alcaligenes faecalis]